MRTSHPTRGVGVKPHLAPRKKAEYPFPADIATTALPVGTREGQRMDSFLLSLPCDIDVCGKRNFVQPWL
jgi:hypothetical protein